MDSTTRTRLRTLLQKSEQELRIAAGDYSGLLSQFDTLERALETDDVDVTTLERVRKAFPFRFQRKRGMETTPDGLDATHELLVLINETVTKETIVRPLPESPR